MGDDVARFKMASLCAIAAVLSNAIAAVINSFWCATGTARFNPKSYRPGRNRRAPTPHPLKILQHLGGMP
jgi:hypothetical protein